MNRHPSPPNSSPDVRWLDQVRDLDESRPATPAVLNAARAELLAGLTGSAGRRWTPARRGWTAAGATVGVAAATTLVLVLTGGQATAPHSAAPGSSTPAAIIPAPVTSSASSRAVVVPPSTSTAPPTKSVTTSRSRPTTGKPATTSTSGKPATSRPALHVEPAAFLHRAAVAALADPAASPRGDQFLYVKEGSYEGWFSMDGAHDGLIYDSTGQHSVVPGCDGSGCTAQPAYLADAPTTAAGMADYIEGLAGSDRPNSLGKELLGIAEFNYLDPDARAALYEAVPLLPGLALSGTSTTNNGQPVVAISWDFSGSTTTLLFDPTSYAFLGCRTDAPGAHNSSSVSRAVVDHTGQRP